jgi:hypothetical protein
MISLDKYAFIMAGKFPAKINFSFSWGYPQEKENSAFLVSENYGFLFTEISVLLFTDYKEPIWHEPV